MRVCMVAYAFYENDTRIMRYAEALAQRGDQVEVIALRRDNQASHGRVDGVKVFRLQKRQPNSSGKLAYGLPVLMFFFRAMVLLTRRHLKHRYQILHIHSVPDFLVFAAWVPKLLGAKVILDIHDLLPEFYASKYDAGKKSTAFRVLASVERASVACADYVITANDLWQDVLLGRSVPRGKCMSMVNLPDRSLFRQQGRTRSDGKFVMLYPGTLNWHQGVDIAIRALALIRDQVSEAELHIYGEGPCRADLEQLVAELGLSDRVFLRGFLPTRAIARVIENADLGVVPKRTDGFGNEAFSTKIMEFMALGVPVIVSDSRIDTYYFNDSLVQFFQGGNERDLARCMLQLIREPQLRQRLAQNASAFVERNSWDIKKQNYLDLVDSLAGTGQAAQSASTKQFVHTS